MKKLLLTFLFIAAAFTCWADDYYVVGDATPFGWVTGDARKPTLMTETGTAGVYEWIGLLKHAEGFFICNSLSGWSGYGSSVPKAEGSFAIEGVGEDECTETDNKWNPTNTDWQLFTITLDTNVGKVSWQAGESFAADAEGFYNIETAKQLYWFSTIVNGNQSAKAKLTANIDYTTYPQGYIGASKSFNGTFDGQEHYITIAIENGSPRCTGLFAEVNGATIRNLIVAGSATSSNDNNVGGLGGRSYGNTLIENVVVKTEISYTGSKSDASCGGIFADMENAPTVKNSAFLGSIKASGKTGNAGLVSWSGGGCKFENCLVLPAEVDVAGFDDYSRGNFSPTNCYKVTEDDARLASGELCYLLNGDQSSIGWYQTLDKDYIPVPFSSRKQVYANGELKCDGTSAGGALVYSNTNESVLPPHTDEEADGRCDVCGNLIPDYLALDDEGFYAITKGSDLKWFGDFVKEVNQSAKAKLTNDIDYTAYPQGFIGADKAFSGVFDGQQHTITVAFQNNAKIRGLFASISGATIKNLVVAGSVTSEFNNLGGLGGQANGGSIIESVVVKTQLNYTPGSGDASCGGFFAYIPNGTVTFKNCAFIGSVKVGSANGNAGLVSWNSGSLNVSNCLIAPEEVEASQFADFARPNASAVNSYSVTVDDERLASGELCYLLNGSSCFNATWTQSIGIDKCPVPFNTQGIVNKITAAGYATQFIPSTDVLIPSDVEAYAGQISGEYLKLIQIERTISKSDAVILKGSEGFYSFIPVGESHPAPQNDLKGADADIAAAGKYVLAMPEDEPVGFYLATSGTIKAGKAYLESPSEVKAFVFDVDNATAIQTIQTIHNESPLYNLSGQRVNKSTKGVFIQNGRKFVK